MKTPIVDTLRHLIVLKLASWIMDIAPKTPSGKIWRDAQGQAAVADMKLSFPESGNG